MSEISSGDRDTGRYEIRVKGHLDQRWTTWFDGMRLSNEDDGTTVVHGPVADQAALHGLLRTVRDTGLPLISVTRVEPDHPDVPTTESRQLTPSDEETDMAITRTTPSKRVPMDSTRRTALVAGVFYLITFVSIPTLGLYATVKGEDFIIGSAASTGALWGGFLEVIVALAGIGTAITLFPVVRRQNEAMALGFVATRTLEAAMIFAGVASLLSLVALRQPGASGADATSLTAVGQALVASYNGAFLLGQSLMPVMNALLLGTLMYRSGLVPRLIPLVGLVGAPLQLTAVVLTMFGVVDRTSTATGILVLPIAFWELSLGVYLVVKGFKPSPITAGMVAAGGTSASGDRPAATTAALSSGGVSR